MKRIKEFFCKKYSFAIVAIFGTLGVSFTSCYAYGSPSADFAISGRVTSAESGKAIEGIEVIGEDSSYIVHTDVDGMYYISDEDVFPPDSINLRFIDIDGESNGGEFSSKSETVKFHRSDFKNGRNWYRGKATKELNVNLELKK